MSMGLVLAALAAPGTALAESKSDRWPSYPGFGRIRCAAASDLCTWKRIPDDRGFELRGFEAFEVPQSRGARPGLRRRR
jgi:hypothetical protein